MNTFKGFASFLLAAAIVSALSAETHCPGNIAESSPTFRKQLPDDRGRLGESFRAV